MASIQAAVACPGPGDTLTMMAGTYTGPTATIADMSMTPNRTRIQNGTAANPIIIEGEGAVGCAITRTCKTVLKYGGTAYPPLFYHRSYITFRRFEVDGSQGQIFGGQCFYSGSIAPVSHHIVFEDIHCHHAWGSGWGGPGNFFRWTRVRSEYNALNITEGAQEHGFYVPVHDSIIEYSYVNNNGHVPPLSGGYGNGIQIYSSVANESANRNIVRYNVVTDNQGGGIAADGTDDQIYGNVLARNALSGLAFGFGCAGGGKILNNTAYGNRGAGLQIGIFSSSCSLGARVENNLVVGNGGAIEYHNGWTNTGKAGSNITSGTLGAYTVSTTDFHLKAGSPAIDAGAAATEVASDIDRVSRPQGAGWDIGAYEFVSAAPVVNAAPAKVKGLRWR